MPADDGIISAIPCPWCMSTYGTYLEGRPSIMGTEWRIVHGTERCVVRVETEWYRSRAEAIDAWNSMG